MKAIILGAGKGSRLHSEEFDLPKVLRELKGKALIEHVLSNINFISEKDKYVIVGFQREKLIEKLKNKCNFVVQEEQLGTGHAVLVAEEELKDYEGDVLILYGDMPLVSEETIRNFITYHESKNSKATIMSANFNNPPAYGRIFKDEKDNLKNIIEERDCTEGQKKVTELNVGIYIFNSKFLFESLKQVKNNNVQSEYYLTDVPKILIDRGETVNIYLNNNEKELVGVNTLEELKYCEDYLDKINNCNNI